MSLPQLPAYLQVQSAKPAINDVARQAVGTSMPPHISIKGNRFTAIDAAENEYDLGIVFQAAVIDVSDATCKSYFENEYEEGSKDPPTCWSANGIGPSIEAQTPQARTCAECPQNIRGSALSRKGTAIKACRDETHLALMFPQQPSMIFRLVITPGSFKNWGAYLDSIKGVALQDLITQVEFVPKENGMLMFMCPGYIPQELLQWREQAYVEKKTDAIVGRNDRPRTGLPAPAAQQQIQPPQEVTMQYGRPVMVEAPTQQVQQPVPFGQGTTSFAPPAGNPSMNTATPSTSAAPAGTASTTSPSEPVRRRARGRPPAQEQVAPVQQPQQQTMQFGQPAPAAGGFTPGPAPGPTAPFRPTPATGAPAGGLGTAAVSPGFGQPTANPAFGIGAGQPPNAEMGAMLSQLFPQKE
jgi:hypothetical protein